MKGRRLETNTVNRARSKREKTKRTFTVKAELVSISQRVATAKEPDKDGQGTGAGLLNRDVDIHVQAVFVAQKDVFQQMDLRADVALEEAVEGAAPRRDRLWGTQAVGADGRGRKGDAAEHLHVVVHDALDRAFCELHRDHLRVCELGAGCCNDEHQAKTHLQRRERGKSKDLSPCFAINAPSNQIIRRISPTPFSFPLPLSLCSSSIVLSLFPFVAQPSSSPFFSTTPTADGGCLKERDLDGLRIQRLVCEGALANQYGLLFLRNFRLVVETISLVSPVRLGSRGRRRRRRGWRRGKAHWQLHLG